MTQPIVRGCTDLDNGRRTCLHQLAAGYRTASDLCPGCTSRLMVALEWIAGADLPWHQGYLDRAGYPTEAS